MGAESDEIKRHIEEKREQLGAHLNELEYRVKTVTDWRAQVSKHPREAVAAAFGGGLLLALLL
jgi:ElaB/YqjD/DUF883 family membrane-anchored ribosome-binding protein